MIGLTEIKFNKEFLDPILKGTKTQTRRPDLHKYSRLTLGEYLWVNGTTLHLKVVGLRLERLQEITENDAIAEGFASVEDFKKVWSSIYGEENWNSNPEIVVIEFIKNS